MPLAFIRAAALAALALQPATASPLPEPAVPIARHEGSAVDLLRCLAGERIPLTSGHRGGPAPGFPENAIETFARTLAQAPMLIEVDVRTTRDGVLVLMHDATLDRTTTGTGPVNERSWAEVQALRLVDNDGRATDFRVPTLAAALEAIRGRGILAIDVKEDASIPAIAAAVAAADARDHAIVNLYRPSQAMILHRLDPAIAIAHPVMTEEDLTVLRAVGVRLDHLAAWTGIEGIDPRPQALWRAMDRMGMPSLYATLFVADRRIQASGDAAIYRELAGQGVDIIPTDLHLRAHAELSEGRDVRGAIERCGARARP